MSSTVPSAAQPFVDLAEGRQPDHPATDVIVDAQQPPPPTVVGPIRRRRLDTVLIAFGAVVTVVLAVAGGLLMWGHNFADDYVGRELTSQNIVFPAAAALQQENRTDLLGYAGQQVTTGNQAEAYAGYIAHHLDGIADGQTYADLSGPERAAKAAVQDAKDQGADQATVDGLQAKATALTAQRDSLFKGETLRGLLLSTYAWATIGTIAGIAAIVCFVAAGVMAALVVLGAIHRHRTA
jgi:hypothetical protein